MPEPFSEQQLAQLEERWRRDPASRVFLQLAEELRRGGRLERAVEILRAGLVRHPNYLSAQVALGRCLLEQGDSRAAAQILERAVGQDPAQLVASRLLIQSYIALGDAANARARLDFYRLFSERDEEFRRLEARVRELESRAAHGASGREPFGALREAPAPTLRFAPERRPPPAADEPFGPLPPPATAVGRFVAACREEAIFAIAAAPLPVVVSELPSRTAADLPIAEATPEPARPWWSAPSADVESPPAPRTPPMAPNLQIAPPLPEPALPPPSAAPTSAAPAPPWRGPATELALERETSLFAATFSPREIGAEVERETIEEPYDEVYSAAATPTPAPAAAAASVTLAELYLEQGHLDEAERAFGAVLADRGEDAAARQGLAEIARRRAKRPAEAPEAAWEQDGAAPPLESPSGSLSRRKAGALRDYLGRLRRGAGAHVP